MLGSTKLPPATKSRNADQTYWTGGESVYYQDFNQSGVPVSGKTYVTVTASFPRKTAQFETLTSDTGKDIFFKHCSHQRTASSNIAQSGKDHSFWLNSTTERRYVNLPRYKYCNMLCKSFSWYAGNPTQVRSSDLPITGQQQDDLMGHAIRTMVPRVEDLFDKFNLLNFLFEFKDMKQMFTLWSGKKGIRKNLSGAVLNAELGWKPFISDVERIYRGVLTLRDNIRRWNSDAKRGVIYTRHCNLAVPLEDLTSIKPSSTVTDQPAHPSGSSIYNPNTGTYGQFYWWCDRTVKVETTMIAHMYFRPKPIRDIEIEDICALWVDALGIGDGASTIWNAVPFTFVVDWFWAFGEFLHQFDVDSVDVGFEVVDFGYSFKTTDHTTIYPHLGVGSRNDGAYFDGGITTLSNTNYVRKRCQAPLWALDDIDWSLLLTFRVPTWKQGWIGLNLISANF